MLTLFHRAFARKISWGLLPEDSFPAPLTPCCETKYLRRLTRGMSKTVALPSVAVRSILASIGLEILDRWCC